MKKQESAVFILICEVVDNLGDIAVCKRLASQLVLEHGFPVEIFCNQAQVFHNFAIKDEVFSKLLKTKEISVFNAEDPGFIDCQNKILLDCFANSLTVKLLNQTYAKNQPRLWIIIDYLTAEAWVESYHLLASPQENGVPRFFFYPGFSERTGGLLRESGLLAERDSFLANEGKKSCLRELGLPELENSLNISLFGYNNPALPALLAGLAKSGKSLRILLPESLIAEQWRQLVWPTQETLEVFPLSFLAQQQYDQLLWSCDINFVRGEDSLVRAIWAGKPFFWQLYVQPENVQLLKMAAFLDVLATFVEAAEEPAFNRYCQLMSQWNGAVDLPNNSASWSELVALAETLSMVFQRFCARLAGHNDLSSQLVQFCLENK